jgi:predicted AAA+ superfamily ATPase
MDQESILWNRTYSTDLPKIRESIELKYLDKTLEKYNAKYIVIGHTPQDKGINIKYNGKVYCIDTGMSEAFGTKKNKLERIHFIEINGPKKKILVY